LTFGPDPATHNHNTGGGMIGNNSCGTHSVMAGKTEENVIELDVLTYDGLRLRVGATSEDEYQRIVTGGGRHSEIYTGLRRIAEQYGNEIRQRFPNIPRRVSGYNLPDLLPESGFHVARALVGTECTSALTLEATVRLVWSPPGRSLVVLGYPDIYQAGDHVPEILQFKPIACEAIDALLVENMKIKGSASAGSQAAAGWARLAPGRVRRRRSRGLGSSGAPLDGHLEETAQCPCDEALG
jgi:FAD/FMN-containing dehydrogenase